MSRYCRICGSKDLKYFAEFNGFHLRRCPNCELTQIADDLSQVRLEDYYDKAFFDSTYGSLLKDDRCRKREYDKFTYRIEEIEKFKPQKGRILDIGCSFGFFLHVAQSRGWSSTGIEIAEYAARYAKESLNLEVYNAETRKSQLPVDHYDVVTMWNVLEHLDDPITELNHLNSLMRKSGLLVFTTGSIDSYVRKLQGLRWRAFIPPIHVAHYNPKSVHTLLKNTGFKMLLNSVALPRERLLQKLGLINILKRIQLSDKFMIFAQKV